MQSEDADTLTEGFHLSLLSLRTVAGASAQIDQVSWVLPPLLACKLLPPRVVAFVGNIAFSDLAFQLP